MEDVVDHLLATCTLCVSAEQSKDLRYIMELAQGGAGRCGQRILNDVSTLMLNQTYYCLDYLNASAILNYITCSI
ncbi:hypothetical protein HanXRQr2_Chr03g0098391 [Helianthus annuus]|uniref:Uncharacterized protein n=1 Tax=Helianthus annuus TaxID=4232 RepID=A0A9K3NVW5_HELAN|nr:hypothetical protein HanXRQr2_Chr03g0098391 [Helianthus annuus]